jgi:PAS domain S-box-containing protein
MGTSHAEPAHPARDLTALAEPRPARDLAAHLFQETAEGLAVVQLSDGVILEANDSFLQLADLPREIVVGADSFQLGLWADLGDDASARAALYEQSWIEDLMATLASPGTGKVSTMKISAERLRSADEEDPLILIRAAGSAEFLHSADRFRILREAEARYRSLMEQLPAIVYTQVQDRSSPTGYRDVYVSPQCEAKLGYTAAEWQADPELWIKVTHPDDLPSVLAEEETTAASDEPFTCVYRMIAKDGRVLWFRDEAIVLKDPISGLEFWKGVMLDITDQKATEEELLGAEARYRTLVERIPAVVYHSEFSEEGDWLYVSPQIEEILGFTPQEWMEHPHPMASFCHPDDVQRVREAEELSLQTGEPFHAEYRMLDRQGRWHWILDEGSVVRDERGRPLHILGVMFDSTDRREAEGAVHDVLERERQAFDKLREMDALKNTLLHTLSHDLKSPLTAIGTAAATLDQLGDALTKEERTDLIRTMSLRARRMDALLSDLLDLDRLDRGIVEPSRSAVNLGDLIRTVLDETDYLDGREVVVQTGEVLVQADRAKTERILENLIANVNRHTPRGSPVQISARRDRDGATLVVADEGPGVADAIKETIFEEFRRGPEAGNRAGSGIGLSLVSRFAALHGGRAWVEDREGGGAAFHVFIPDRAAEAQ